MATPKLEHIRDGLYAVRWAKTVVEFDVMGKDSNLDGRSHQIVRARVGRRRAIFTASDEQ
jgi:lysyl-tRNA synthetase class I